MNYKSSTISMYTHIHRNTSKCKQCNISYFCTILSIIFKYTENLIGMMYDEYSLLICRLFRIKGLYFASQQSFILSTSCCFVSKFMIDINEASTCKNANLKIHTTNKINTPDLLAYA